MTFKDMKDRIVRARNAMTPEIFERVSLTLIDRLRTSIDCNEQHFKHYLY